MCRPWSGYAGGMTRIAVLTPDPADPSYSGQWPGVLERLSKALEAADVTVEPTPWTDHIEDASGLTGYPLVLPVIVWGYHRDHARWMQACRTWEEAGVRMLNPARVIGWNSDKSYLGRLADRGVAVPETIWVEGVTQADVDAAFDRLGTDVVVVKPRVSGGAWKTLRLTRGEAMVGAPEGPAMIQPYLPSMERPACCSSAASSATSSTSGRSAATSASRCSSAGSTSPCRSRRRARWRWRRRPSPGSMRPCSTPGSTWRRRPTAAGV